MNFTLRCKIVESRDKNISALISIFSETISISLKQTRIKYKK
jgi:hypothetical protein